MKLLTRILTVVALVLAARGTAHAADGSWNVDVGASWITGTNWLGGIIPGSTTATNSTDIATFGFTLTGGRSISVDANRNVGGITFSNTSGSGYTLTGGSLRLSNGGVIRTAAGNGAHTDQISSPTAIQGDGGSGTFTAGATNASSLLRFAGAVTGVSTAGNTTTLTLNGDNTGANGLSSLGDGSSGGKLAVVKSGNGTWLFLGNNTFTGGLTLSGGRLGSNGDNRLGSGTVTFNGGGLVSSTSSTVRSATNAILFTGSGTIETVNLSGPVDLGGATRIVSASNATFSGVISNGGLTKTGAGTLTLSNANAYTGATTVSSGTLTVGDGVTAGSIAASGSVAIDSGATLNFNRTDDYGGDYSIPISGDGVLRVAAGTLSLTGNNASYSGPVSIAGGTLSIGSSNSLGTGTVSFAVNNAAFRASSDVSLSNNFRSMTNTGGGTFAFTGSNSISAGQLIYIADAKLNNTIASNKTLTFASLTNDGTSRTANILGSGNTTFTNGVLNNGTATTALNIDSTGTTTIGGTSTFTGGLTQNAGGRLVINGPLLGSTGTYSGNTTANGTIEYASSGTTVASGNLSGSGNFIVNGGGSWVQRGGVSGAGTWSILSGKYTYSSQIGTGTGTLVLGGGSLVNAGGAVTLRNPTLIFAGNPTFGDATNTAAIGFQDTVTGSTFSGWTADLGGATRTLTVLATSATIPHVVSNGGLTKSGTGNLTLSNTNTYSGDTLVQSGTLFVGSDLALQNSGFDTSGAGRLSLAGRTAATFGGLLGSVNLATSATYAGVSALTLNPQTGTSYDYGGVIANGTSAGMSLTKTGLGSQRLTGVSTYTGTTFVNAGRLEIAGSGNLANTAGVVINGSGAELKWNSSTALSRPITFTQGTISGTGAIGVAVAVATNDILSPGNSPGYQAYTAGLTWSPGGTYQWEINNATGAADVNWDILNVSGGALDLSGLSSGSTFALDLTTLTGTVPGPMVNYVDGQSYTFSLASYASLVLPGGFSGNDLTSLFSLSFANWRNTAPSLANVSVVNNTVANTIDLVIVPEPTGLAVAGIAFAAAGWLLRRRRTAA